MQPCDRPCLAGAPFDEIAHSVDEPQAVSACGVGWKASPAGERISDVATVLDLAQYLVTRTPETDGARTSGVPERIGGDLADRDDQVGDAPRVETSRATLIGRELPNRPEVSVEFNRCRVVCRRRQRLIAAGRQPAGTQV